MRIKTANARHFNRWIIILVLVMIALGCQITEPATQEQNPAPEPEPEPEVEADYYVAPTGNDSNPGTKSKPYQTIQKAADILKPGETLLIRGGIYRERVIPKNSGNSGSGSLITGTGKKSGTGNYITYAAYPGERVTLDGSSISLPEDWGGLFEITGKKYIRVSGLRISNVGQDQNHCGILVYKSENIIIEKNITYNTQSSGIGIWASRNVVVDGNDVELACNGGEQECLTVASTDGFEISHNQVHHSGSSAIGGEGIDAKDGSRNGKIFNNVVHHLNRLGIYVDAWDKPTGHIEVYRNKVYHCRGDGIAIASENGGLLENVRIYNNLIYNNEFSGIATGDWGEEGAAHPLKNIFIINNTIYNNGWNDWGGGIAVSNRETQNLVIRNNICSQNLLYQILVETPDTGFLTVEYNLIHGYRSHEQEIYGANPVTGDPLFTVPGTDFHLEAGSPAIDAGTSKGAPATDFDGIIRPQGAGYDIGAYEKKD